MQENLLNLSSFMQSKSFNMTTFSKVKNVLVVLRKGLLENLKVIKVEINNEMTVNLKSCIKFGCINYETACSW